MYVIYVQTLFGAPNIESRRVSDQVVYAAGRAVCQLQRL